MLHRNLDLVCLKQNQVNIDILTFLFSLFYNQGQTPLHYAIIYNQNLIVSELLNRGSDPSVEDQHVIFFI